MKQVMYLFAILFVLAGGAASADNTEQTKKCIQDAIDKLEKAGCDKVSSYLNYLHSRGKIIRSDHFGEVKTVADNHDFPLQVFDVIHLNPRYIDSSCNQIEDTGFYKNAHDRFTTVLAHEALHHLTGLSHTRDAFGNILADQVYRYSNEKDCGPYER